MDNENYTVPEAVFTEKPDGYELKVMLPGVGKEDAELHMDGRTLTLKTRVKYQNPAGFRKVVGEFERQNYAMSADLPEMADPSSLAAKLENGVLCVSIGKKPETKAKKIEIL